MPVWEDKSGKHRTLKVELGREMQEVQDKKAERRNDSGLLAVRDQKRESGRRAIHEGKVKFRTWVDHQGGVPDIGAYIF